MPPVATSKELYGTPAMAVASGQLSASAGGVPPVYAGPGLITVLVSNVTVPICANDLPFIAAPVATVMDA